MAQNSGPTTEGHSVLPPPSPSLKRTHSISNHPYAIKTTSTALLSRSNSTGQSSHFAHSYSPTVSPSPSRIGRGHKHTKSLSSLEMPPSLPVPPSPSSPAMVPSFSAGNLTDSETPSNKPGRLKRSGTLPSFPNKSDTEAPSSPKIELPANPKFWTPSQLSIYLTTALRLKGGGAVPVPVAKDIAAFVVKEKLTGRAFVRLTEETLEGMGINKLWRDALLEASRTLRQDILKGRIFGFGNPPDHPRSKARVPSTVPEQEESRFNSIRRSRSGRVRGLVANFERAASQSSDSSSRSSSPVDQRYETAEDGETNEVLDDTTAMMLLAEYDDGFASGESSREPSLYEGNEGHAKATSDEQQETDNKSRSFGTPPPVYHAVAHTMPSSTEDPFEDHFAVDADTTIRNDEATLDPLSTQSIQVSVPIVAEEPEPSMDDLLSSEMSGSWGAKAWEEVDAVGNTARMLTQVISPSRSRIHAPVTDLFQTKTSPAPPPEPSVIIAPRELPENDGQPSPLELLDAFRRRLEEVERKLDEMEVREAERERQQKEKENLIPPSAPPNINQVHVVQPSEEPTPELAEHVETSKQAEPSHTQVDEPTVEPDRPVAKTPSYDDPLIGSIPGYVLMVGLGVCLVVARVMIRRIGGKRP